MGLIQQNTDEGRCLLENPPEMLMFYPAAQILWLGSHVVMLSTFGLQTARFFFQIRLDSTLSLHRVQVLRQRNAV